MHWHGNPNHDRAKAVDRNAALRFTPGDGVAVPGFETADFRRPPLGLNQRRTAVSDISAELLAASASFADMAAVCAAVPQLGASLPSHQARGR